MLRRSFRQSLSLLLVLSSFIYMPGAGAADAAGGEYILTRQYGSVMFRVFHQQYLNLVGRFDDYAGTLTLDPQNLANSTLTARVTMTSLNMADADVVETLVNSSVWFNGSVFPEATFTSTSAEVTGDNEVDFHGDLNFVGMTKPWTFHVKFNPGTTGELGGNTVGIYGTGTINRLDFGLNQYTNMAAEMVEIEVNAKFNRKQ
ncbi:MAG: YceI family protein [Pseudomonadota bacterium]|nr:YceI family protein [Pseudomonadota bacterium]